MQRSSTKIVALAAALEGSIRDREPTEVAGGNDRIALSPRERALIRCAPLLAGPPNSRPGAADHIEYARAAEAPICKSDRLPSTRVLSRRVFVFQGRREA